MKLKRKKIKNNIFYLILILFLILQIILIAHRNSFELKYFFKFHLSNIGLKDGIKNQIIFDIVTLIKKNDIKRFNLADDLFDQKNKFEKIHHKLYQRVIEASYPSKFSENSNIIISLDKKKFSTCELVDKQGNIYVFKC
tara:strand:- start:154 stop:570 length:417 start_codon:yes stop_codon:yes gene_type:complete